VAVTDKPIIQDVDGVPYVRADIVAAALFFLKNPKGLRVDGLDKKGIIKQLTDAFVERAMAEGGPGSSGKPKPYGTRARDKRHGITS
jgi:hypothetical protein